MAINLAEVIYQWETIGFFNIILPFLLIFAVIWGVLSYSKLFGDNKGIQVMIALAMGLLAIRVPYFSDFLAEISPRLAVGLVILLAMSILIGLFTVDKTGGILGWIFIGVGLIILIVILAQTAEIFGILGYSSFTNNDLVGYVILVALLIGMIVAIVTSHPTNPNETDSMSKRSLGPLWGGHSRGP